jgi:hypothetical protein
MSKVVLHIEKCQDCPHLEISIPYSFDGFDCGNDWRCKEANRKIAEFVESPSQSPKKIPSWCPLRVKDSKKDDNKTVDRLLRKQSIERSISEVDVNDGTKGQIAITQSLRLISVAICSYTDLKGTPEHHRCDCKYGVAREGKAYPMHEMASGCCEAQFAADIIAEMTPKEYERIWKRMIKKRKY